MPIYTEGQKITNPKEACCQKISLRNNEGTWEINRWNGAGWVSPPSQTTYVPEIAVKRFKINAEGQNAIVEYCLAGGNGDVVDQSTVQEFSTNVIDTFLVNEVYYEQVTMVYLSGSSSAFTSMVLGS